MLKIWIAVEFCSFLQAVIPRDWLRPKQQQKKVVFVSPPPIWVISVIIFPCCSRSRCSKMPRRIEVIHLATLRLQNNVEQVTPPIQ